MIGTKTETVATRIRAERVCTARLFVRLKVKFLDVL